MVDEWVDGTVDLMDGTWAAPMVAGMAAEMAADLAGASVDHTAAAMAEKWVAQTGAMMAVLMVAY